MCQWYVTMGVTVYLRVLYPKKLTIERTLYVPQRILIRTFTNPNYYRNLINWSLANCQYFQRVWWMCVRYCYQTDKQENDDNYKSPKFHCNVTVHITFYINRAVIVRNIVNGFSINYQWTPHYNIDGYIWPYHADRTYSPPITEVKQPWSWSGFGWWMSETGWLVLLIGWRI